MDEQIFWHTGLHSITHVMPEFMFLRKETFSSRGSTVTTHIQSYKNFASFASNWNLRNYNVRHGKVVFAKNENKMPPHRMYNFPAKQLYFEHLLTCTESIRGTHW